MIFDYYYSLTDDKIENETNIPTVCEEKPKTEFNYIEPSKVKQSLQFSDEKIETVMRELGESLLNLISDCGLIGKDITVKSKQKNIYITTSNDCSLSIRFYLGSDFYKITKKTTGFEASYQSEVLNKAFCIEFIKYAAQNDLLSIIVLEILSRVEVSNKIVEDCEKLSESIRVNKRLNSSRVKEIQ